MRHPGRHADDAGANHCTRSLALPLAELQGRLNASELVSSFTTELRGSASALRSLTVPLDAHGVRGIVGAGRIDLSSLSSAASRVASTISARPIALPDPGALVGQVQGLIALLEELDLRNIDAAVRGTIDQVTAALRLNGGTRIDVAIEQVAAALGASAEGRAVLGVLARIVRLVGGEAAFVQDFKALLPAGLALLRAVGGLMRVESALSEGERLALLLRDQLARDTTRAELHMVHASIAYAIERVTAARTDETVVDEAERAARDALARIDLVRDSIARRFAFAESTLLYADLPGTLAEVRGGLADAQGVDLAAAGASVGRMVDRLMPALSIPLPPAPADSFDALLRMVEGAVATIAERIEAMDMAPVGAPISTLAAAVTTPIRELQRLSDELTQSAQQVTRSATSLVESLPPAALAAAINDALAPVRTAMGAVRDAIAAIEGALGGAATAATAALVRAEGAVDALMAALQALVGDAATFVTELGVDRAIGELQERLRTLATALEQAAVQPYFAAAETAIDSTASVLEKVPVVMLPDDIKAEFDALVEPLRALNVDAVAGEVESWFELEDGALPFEPPLTAAIADVQGALQSLLDALQPMHPRQLATIIDAELDPLRREASRLDLAASLQPVEAAIASLRSGLDGIDPAAALAPVSRVIGEVADQLDALDPATLIAPLQARLVEVRESVIATLRLDAASKALGDLEREGVRVVTLLDPVRLEPMIADGLEVARRELATLDRATMGQWGSTLVSAMLAGDGSRRRPTSWALVFDAIVDGNVTARLSARAQRIASAVQEAVATTASLDLGATTVAVTAGLRSLRTAVEALPAGAPLRVALGDAVRRRAADGGFGELEVHRTRFAADLLVAQGPATTLLQLELSRVDVTAVAIGAAMAPIARVRHQLLGVLRQLGIRRVGDGLGAILGEVLAVASPQRLAAIVVPVFTAVRGRAEALLAAVVGPLRGVIDELLTLLRSIDLLALTQGVGDVIEAGKAQVRALDPVTLLAPSLAAFATLRDELRRFDPLAPVRAVLDALQRLIARLVGTPSVPGTLSAERILAPAAALFDALIRTLRQLDVEPLLRPLLDALRLLATDISGGIDGLRAGLKRLQAAIPSTEGLSLGSALGAVGVSADLDVDIGF